MSFEEEWSQHKRTAAERQPSDMRLNQLPREGGGGGDVMASAPAKKKRAANAVHYLQGETPKAADLADEPTSKAAQLFADWDTGAGLKKAHTHWDDQVKRLMDRLDTHRNALQDTAVLLRGSDVEVGYDLRRSAISKVSGI